MSLCPCASSPLRVFSCCLRVLFSARAFSRRSYPRLRLCTPYPNTRVASLASAGCSEVMSAINAISLLRKLQVPDRHLPDQHLRKMVDEIPVRQSCRAPRVDSGHKELIFTTRLAQREGFARSSPACRVHFWASTPVRLGVCLKPPAVSKEGVWQIDPLGGCAVFVAAQEAWQAIDSPLSRDAPRLEELLADSRGFAQVLTDMMLAHQGS
jgi:hypothetical protein